MVLEKLGIQPQKDETESPSFTINKNQLKMDQRSELKTSNYKSTVENPGKLWTLG